MYSFLCHVRVEMAPRGWLIGIAEEDQMCHSFMVGNSSLIVKIKGAAKLHASFSLDTVKFKYVYRSSVVWGV